MVCQYLAYKLAYFFLSYMTMCVSKLTKNNLFVLWTNSLFLKALVMSCCLNGPLMLLCGFRKKSQMAIGWMAPFFLCYGDGSVQRIIEFAISNDFCPLKRSHLGRWGIDFCSSKLHKPQLLWLCHIFSALRLYNVKLAVSPLLYTPPLCYIYTRC